MIGSPFDMLEVSRVGAWLVYEELRASRERCDLWYVILQRSIR